MQPGCVWKFSGGLTHCQKLPKMTLKPGFGFLQGNPDGNSLMKQAIEVKYRLRNLA